MKNRQATCALALLSVVLLAGGPVSLAKTADEFVKNASNEFSRGNFKGAEREYRQALGVDARHPYAQLGLACTLMEQDRLSEAEQVLGQLIAAHPDFEAGYYLQGRLYERQGKDMQAKAAFQQYVTKAKGNIPPDPSVRLKLRKYGVF